MNVLLVKQVLCLELVLEVNVLLHRMFLFLRCLYKSKRHGHNSDCCNNGETEEDIETQCSIGTWHFQAQETNQQFLTRRRWRRSTCKQEKLDEWTDG